MCSKEETPLDEDMVDAAAETAAADEAAAAAAAAEAARASAAGGGGSVDTIEVDDIIEVDALLVAVAVSDGRDERDGGASGTMRGTEFMEAAANGVAIDEGASSDNRRRAQLLHRQLAQLRH